MKSWSVYTELDLGIEGVRFPTREQAQQALDALRELVPKGKFQIVEKDKPPNMTFAEWNEDDGTKRNAILEEEEKQYG